MHEPLGDDCEHCASPAGPGGPSAGTLSRRRFLIGAGAAALGTGLVTTRASFGAPGSGALVVIFLRGGADGLSIIVPGDDPDLLAARPKIAVPSSVLLPLDRGFGLHPTLAPLHELWTRGQFTAVPAVSTTDVSRSHFQAQDCRERGGSATGTVEGWLDRVLDQLGPGTPFRAVAAASTLPRALAGLYAGIDHPVAADVSTTLAGLDVTFAMTAAGYQPGATYPQGEFGEGLAQLAQLLKADVGLRVACVDVSSWDHHANLGTVDGGEMKNSLTMLGGALAAFAADLGPRFDEVTVVAMTEFGRRVAENANGGTDHGHGAAVLLLGGGLAGGTIHGNWPGLSPAVLDQGDVPGANDYRDVLGEVVTRRLGLGADALAAVFPEHRVQPLGVTR